MKGRKGIADHGTRRIPPITFALLLCAATAPALSFAAESWPAETSPVNIGPVAGGLPGSEEVSAAVWNPILQRLYVVDDNTGDISRMDAAGSNKVSWTVSESDHDHEALTFADFNSPYIYVGVEQTSAGAVRLVRKYNIGGASATLVQTWTLTEMGTGSANSGLEGLTFVPNEFLKSFPDTTNAVYNSGQGSRYGAGGLFFASLQATGDIYVYDLDIINATTNYTFVRKFTPVSGRDDLSDMEFDRSSGLLYLLWDGANLLATWAIPSITETNGHRQHEWNLWSGGSSRSDEGVAVANTCASNGTSRLFVTDDNGENIYRFDQWPCPSVVSIAVGDAVASETNATDVATFTVSRTNDLAPAVSIAYRIAGTASNGVDFATLSGSITLASNVTNQTITITPVPDTLAEGDESVILTLSLPGGCVIGAASNATATIRDKPYDDWRFTHFTPAQNADPSFSGETADPDGDGHNNLEEFNAGTDPTNSLSQLRILSLALDGDNVNIGWRSAGGHTNIVQSAAPPTGDYTTNAFTDLSGPIAITGSGDVLTNFVDNGGATNEPTRYYRVRIVP